MSSGIKHAPVVVRLREKDILKLDLLKELRIDKHRLDRELLQQPSVYGFWASLYSEVEAKVELLEIELQEKHSELFKHYMKKYPKIKATELKHLIIGNPSYQKRRRRLWKWKKSERFLDRATRGFEQRLHSLQSYSANQRKERDSEPHVRNKSES